MNEDEVQSVGCVAIRAIVDGNNWTKEINFEDTNSNPGDKILSLLAYGLVSLRI